MKWEVGQVDGFLTFKCKSNGRYLEGKTEAGSTTVLTDRVPKGDKTIGFAFGFIEGQKTEFKISEYSVSQTTLEQIFSAFANMKIDDDS